MGKKEIKMEGKLYKIRNNSTEYLGCSISTSEEIPLTQKSHYHDYYQIYYVLRGSLMHTVDGKYIKVMQGDSFIVPPFLTHKIAIEDDSTRFVSFSFFEDFIFEEAKESDTIKAFFAKIASGNLIGRIALNQGDLVAMNNLTSFARNEFKAKKPGYISILKGILTSMLVILSRNYGMTERTDKSNIVLLAAIEYINQHFKEKLTISDLSGHLFYSEATINRVFKPHTGFSFKQYLTMGRIRNARALLRDTDMDITMVAIESGYDNYSAFYRAFMKQMQLSPYDYRKQYRKRTAADCICKTNE